MNWIRKGFTEVILSGVLTPSPILEGKTTNESAKTGSLSKSMQLHLKPIFRSRLWNRIKKKLVVTCLAAMAYVYMACAVHVIIFSTGSKWHNVPTTWILQVILLKYPSVANRNSYIATKVNELPIATKGQPYTQQSKETWSLLRSNSTYLVKSAPCC